MHFLTIFFSFVDIFNGGHELMIAQSSQEQSLLLQKIIEISAKY